MRKEMLKRMDDLIRSPYTTPSEWSTFRTELAAERCENCACWDSDPSSAPDVKIPYKTYARVCFALTIQDWYAGDFHSDGAVATKEEFYCSHFEKKGS